MTRKDYQLIAEVLRRTRDDLRHADLDLINARFAEMLRQDNPRFDERRFLDACTAEGVPCAAR